MRLKKELIKNHKSLSKKTHPGQDQAPGHRLRDEEAGEHRLRHAEE